MSTAHRFRKSGAVEAGQAAKQEQATRWLLPPLKAAAFASAALARTAAAAWAAAVGA